MSPDPQSSRGGSSPPAWLLGLTVNLLLGSRPSLLLWSTLPRRPACSGLGPSLASGTFWGWSGAGGLHPGYLRKVSPDWGRHSERESRGPSGLRRCLRPRLCSWEVRVGLHGVGRCFGGHLVRTGPLGSEVGHSRVGDPVVSSFPP